MTHPGRPRGDPRHLRRHRATRRSSSTSTTLGITAIELMPVHQFVNDSTLRRPGPVELLGLQHDRLPRAAQRLRGVRHPRPAGAPSSRRMVKALHEAGHRGHPRRGLQPHRRGQPAWARPSAFRGIDNAAYYRLVDDDKAHYYDTTGTGNSLLMRNPHVLQLIMDSLRYWVHRDARRRLPVRPRRDPGPAVPRGRQAVGVLRPHPAGPGDLPGQADRRAVGRRRRRLPGRQLPAAVDRVERQVPRHRPRLLARRAARRLGEFASRLTGSSDLYEHSGRKPIASINFVIAHDGFTLRDLVSYNEKHNEANGEDGNDGESHNRSWNCGVEGPTDDPEVNALRLRQQRNFLTTLLLCQGVPMLAARRRARAAPRAATTTATARTTRSPGSTGTSTRTSSDLLALHRGGSSSCAATTRCSGAAGSSPATADHGGESELGDIAWFEPGRQRTWTRTPGPPASPAR